MSIPLSAMGGADNLMALYTGVPEIEEGTVIRQGDIKHTVRKRDKRIYFSGPDTDFIVTVVGSRRHLRSFNDATTLKDLKENLDDFNVPRVPSFTGGNLEIYKDPILNCETAGIKLAEGYSFKPRMFDGLYVKAPSRTDVVSKLDKNEEVAIETLRDMISETEYRKFIKYGFILVLGRSNRVYQVFRNKTHIKVWEKGSLVEEICVNLKDEKIPATDKLIAFKIMIETDENDFKASGNVYNMRKAA